MAHPRLTPAPPVLVIMGVSGSGKTTVARPLAERLGWTFKEGDGLHPPANIAKMKAGIPLTDADRAPWLAAIAAWIDGHAAAGHAGVVTCSALKRAYRDRLTDGRPQVRIVFLKGSEPLIAERVAKRTHHFMPPSLLASQFATLEPPTPEEHPIVVDIAQPVAAQVEAIVRALGSTVGESAPLHRP
ncbi:MAG: gluconokinase [Pseudomonadota bacterium]|nr:gluconokinase [Pseudomonadota bacterium]